jgi:hypothetical protein
MLSAEMEQVRALRVTWGVPDFRDNKDGESVSEYRRALDDARIAKTEKPRVFGAIDASGKGDVMKVTQLLRGVLR